VNILVLGLGNTLLTDEGVGVAVASRVRTALPDTDGIEVLDGGTLSFTLAEPIESADALVVTDAAQLYSPPGTIQVMRQEAMDHFVAYGPQQSVHEVGLSDLLTIARLAERLPAQRALVGIQPEILDWGDHLTPAVEAAVETAKDRVLQLIEEWRYVKT
jgi:hydrogenase maturation protease